MRRVILIVPVVLGCYGEVVAPPLGLRPFASLTLGPQAVFMGTGSTQQLTATPKDGSGVVLTGLPAPVFTSSDTTIAKVSPTGLVTAIAPGVAEISASVESGRLAYTDFTDVTVLQTSLPLDTLVLTPAQDTMAVGDFRILQVEAFGPDSTPEDVIFPPFVSSSDTAKVRVCCGSRAIIAGAPGSVVITATVTSNGVTKTTTETITVTEPMQANVLVSTGPNGVELLPPDSSSLVPPVVTIAPGGQVQWLNNSGSSSDSITVDVTFDTPDVIPGGNISPFGAGASDQRTFPVAGSFTYRSTTVDAKRNKTTVLHGKVIVK